MPSLTPCQQCGACCAAFRVSFYCGEAEPPLAGGVPADLTEQISPYLIAMRGTQTAPVRCIALEGKIGENVRCAIYTRRSSTCRDLEPHDSAGRPDEKCSRARALNGLAPLPPRQGS
jgi:uncharacterized protein